MLGSPHGVPSRGKCPAAARIHSSRKGKVGVGLFSFKIRDHHSRIRSCLSCSRDRCLEGAGSSRKKNEPATGTAQTMPCHMPAHMSCCPMWKVGIDRKCAKGQQTSTNVAC